MVLFNQPGEEQAYAWMEDLVFENMTNCLTLTPWSRGVVPLTLIRSAFL